METQDRATLKARMTEELESLRAAIADLEQSSVSVEPDVAIGRLSRLDTMLNEGIKASSLAQSKERVRKLELALLRLEKDPDFGECVECGDPIPMARLLALPESQLCVECAQ